MGFCIIWAGRLPLSVILTPLHGFAFFPSCGQGASTVSCVSNIDASTHSLRGHASQNYFFALSARLQFVSFRWTGDGDPLFDWKCAVLANGPLSPAFPLVNSLPAWSTFPEPLSFCCWPELLAFSPVVVLRALQRFPTGPPPSVRDVTACPLTHDAPGSPRRHEPRAKPQFPVKCGCLG